MTMGSMKILTDGQQNHIGAKTILINGTQERLFTMQKIF